MKIEKKEYEKGLINSHWYPKSLIKKWGTKELAIYNLKTRETQYTTAKKIFATKAKNFKDNESFKFYENEIQKDEAKMLQMFKWKSYQLKKTKKILGTFRGVDTNNLMITNYHTFPIVHYIAKYLTRSNNLFMREVKINFGGAMPTPKNKKSVNDMNHSEKSYNFIKENNDPDSQIYKEINYMNIFNNILDSFQSIMNFIMGDNISTYCIALMTISAYLPLVYPPLGIIQIENECIYFFRVSPGQYILVGKLFSILKYFEKENYLKNIVIGKWIKTSASISKFIDIWNGEKIFAPSNLYEVYDPKKILVKFNTITKEREINCLLSSGPTSIDVILKIETLKIDKKIPTI